MGGDYQFLVKNKNGEAIADCLVMLKFQHKYYHTKREIQLRTDKDGMINLGPLKNISYVRYLISPISQ